MHLKDGGDGAGTMSALKSKQAVRNNDGDDDEDEEDGDHIFQYGIIPLKLTSGEQDKPIWQNKVPNVIDIDLLNLVIKLETILMRMAWQ